MAFVVLDSYIDSVPDFLPFQISWAWGTDAGHVIHPSPDG
jgi:hypothetical protein